VVSETGATKHRIVIANKHGEKLVGILHQTGSNKIVVLCHGFTASKVYTCATTTRNMAVVAINSVTCIMEFNACLQKSGVIVDLADAITKQGVSIFRFDFSGNG
jgi:hypothetical protein